MNCAIYCRFSSENQREGFSIEAQEAECKEFAQKQGWTVVQIYKDEATTGRDDDRDAFQEMIQHAKSSDHPFGFIVVHKFDRFARNTLDSITQKYMLAKHGIEVISVRQSILGGDPATNRLIERITEAVDENYSINLSQESIKGMKEAAKRGYWNGGYPPFGYKTYPVDTDKGIKKKLAIVEAEAVIVREIFDMYLRGSGITNIRIKLTSQGLKYRNSGTFTNNLISNILRSEKYIGSITFGKKTNKRKRVFFKGFDPITVHNVHPPIVDKDVWDKVQEIVKNREVLSEANSYYRDTEYLFSGILKCKCGAAMVGKSAHGRMSVHTYYVCNKKIKKGSCKAKDIPSDKFENWILTDLAKELTEPERIMKFINGYNEFISGVKRTSGSSLKNINLELKKIDQKLTRLFEAIEDGIGISKEDIAPRIKELNALKERLLLEQERLTRDNELEQIEMTKNKVSDISKIYQELFSSEGMKKNKSRCQSLIDEIIIKPDGQAEISYNPELGIKKKVFVLCKPGEPFFTYANQKSQDPFTKTIFKLNLDMVFFWNHVARRKKM